MHPPICFFTYTSIPIPPHPPIRFTQPPPILVHLPTTHSLIHPPLHPSTEPNTHPSISLFIYLLIHLPLHPRAPPSTHPAIHAPLHPTSGCLSRAQGRFWGGPDQISRGPVVWSQPLAGASLALTTSTDPRPSLRGRAGEPGGPVAGHGGRAAQQPAGRRPGRVPAPAGGAVPAPVHQHGGRLPLRLLPRLLAAG